MKNTKPSRTQSAVQFHAHARAVLVERSHLQSCHTTKSNTIPLPLRQPKNFNQTVNAPLNSIEFFSERHDHSSFDQPACLSSEVDYESSSPSAKELASEVRLQTANNLANKQQQLDRFQQLIKRRVAKQNMLSKMATENRALKGLERSKSIAETSTLLEPFPPTHNLSFHADSRLCIGKNYAEKKGFNDIEDISEAVGIDAHSKAINEYTQKARAALAEDMASRAPVSSVTDRANSNTKHFCDDEAEISVLDDWSIVVVPPGCGEHINNDDIKATPDMSEWRRRARSDNNFSSGIIHDNRTRVDGDIHRKETEPETPPSPTRRQHKIHGRTPHNGINIGSSLSVLEAQSLIDREAPKNPGRILEEQKLRAQESYLNLRRMFMGMERERVREHTRDQKHQETQRSLKNDKEAVRERQERLLNDCLFPEKVMDQEQDNQNKKMCNWEHIQRMKRHDEVEKRTRRQVEYVRYSAAIKKQMQERAINLGLSLPPICSCADSLWETDLNTCANNCPFYKDNLAYQKTMTAVLTAFGLIKK